MAIYVPPWITAQSANPADETGQGMELGQRAVAQQQSNQQAQQAQSMREQQMMEQQHQQEVQNQLQQQRMKMMTDAAAHSYQAQQDYQNAIKGGMDPVQAAMMYGPQMSGGKMTGYSPIFTDYAKTHAPQPPPFKPTPVTDSSGKIIGYSDKAGAVRYLPIPKPPPINYETDTTVTPGTKGVPGTPGVPAVSPHDLLGFKWGGSPAIPGVPAIPGTPETRVSRRIPIDGASAPTAAPPNPNDPLGLFTQ